MNNFSEKVNFIWSIAELLRGPYKPERYGRVILPMCVLRRFDCVLDETKDKVLKKYHALKKMEVKNIDPVLNKEAGENFHNKSKYDFKKLLHDPNNIADNLKNYIQGFSKDAYEIIEYFDFFTEIDNMNKNDLLYLVVKRFSEIDLHPEAVSNVEMGYIFEELIRRFSEHAEAGDHYTPREVIRLMVNLLFIEDEDILTKEGITQTMYDPACGTGGMGSVTEEYLKELNPSATLEFFGQEINPESYAVCKSDILIKGSNPAHIAYGNTLSDEAFYNEHFDYLITNPPYGVEWKPSEKAVKDEAETKGFNGRFGAGLPRISDGQLLFLQVLLHKMKQTEKGSRVAIIMNGSPLFTGDAGSGESNIRKWIIENDLLEGLVALPDQMFYNTGISTYIWILTNRKSKIRKGKIQLVNGVDFFSKMRKSLGNKRNELSEADINEITNIYGDFKQKENCKIFDNEDFGYYKITVERPLRLNFKIDIKRIELIKEQKAFQNLSKTRKKGKAGEKELEQGKKFQNRIIKALKNNASDKLYKNREVFLKVFDSILEKEEISLKPSVKKAILNALSEKDETADICRDKKGNPEPDSDLRDTENVPLKRDINEYFKDEVLPHVGDAWIDEDKTKIGYEIPFTRHFYKYEPLRPSAEIKKEIEELEQRILDKMKKVLS